MSYLDDKGKYQDKLDKLAFEVEPHGDGAGLLGAALFLLRDWTNESIPAKKTIDNLVKTRYTLSKKGWEYLENFFASHDPKNSNSYEDLVSDVLVLLEEERKKTHQSLKLHWGKGKAPAKAKAPKVKAPAKSKKGASSVVKAPSPKPIVKSPKPIVKSPKPIVKSPKPIMKSSKPKAKAKVKVTFAKDTKKNMTCPNDKVLNPATGRCVAKTGKIGKSLLGK